MGAGATTIGPFVLDRSRMALLQGGKVVAIGQRGFALLATLADRDDVVGKAELMDAAWPGVTVEEGNLTVQIAALRKALGTRPDGSDWIITVPRVGYRLVRDQAPRPPSERPRMPTLVVLPFQNMSDDPTQDYFADGIVDEITMALSRFRNFAVVARNSAFVYKNRVADARSVARELGVSYLLEGTVRRALDKLRVSAQLIDGESGSHLWAQRYDGALDDVFEFQDSIVESVAVVLEPEIRRAEIGRSRQERPGSAAAYDLYLRGLYHLNTNAVDENSLAYDLFRRAAAAEPENGCYLMYYAWTMLFARAMGWPGAPRDAAEQIEATHRAVELSPSDGDVLARAALVLMHTSREYDFAEALIARALEANPNSFWVMHCAGIWHLHCGDLERTLDYLRRVSELSPNDPNTSHTMSGIAHALIVMGRYREALEWAERSLAVNRSFSATHWMLISANAFLGDLDAAHRYLELFTRVAPGTTIASIRAGQPAKIPARIETILEGLRIAGLPER